MGGFGLGSCTGVGPKQATGWINTSQQANKCAHVLTKYACFNASLYESFVIPSWLEEVFISDLLST